jgi:hypothetical protein
MTIRDELLALRDGNELLTAEMVVEWARTHPDSDLHNAPQFHGWDIKRSAHQAWIAGARQLIAIHIRTEEGVRELVSLSIDRSRKGGGYRFVSDVLRDKRLHDVMLADALKELERVQFKYQQLNELKPVWKATERVRQRKQRKEERVPQAPRMAG